MKPVIWGVLGGARIAMDRVIPAMQASPLCDVRAIASRDPERARTLAARAGVAQACASYAALLADPDIEAVYIPLPNHLHVEWSIAALDAGKHVLCEKPIAVTASDVAPLIAARDRTGLCVEEAFMVREHPQWASLKALLGVGPVGDIRSVQMSYCHFNDDPDDIRNRPDAGGGSLHDVGSYCATIARLLFDDEPRRVVALADVDERFGVDRMLTAVLEFERGHASFVCSTQASRYQMLQVVGSTGWARAEVPFAHPPDLPARLVIGDNVAPGTEAARTVRFDPVNQYTLQGERFSRLVRGENVPQWPLETAAANMHVIDALHRSARNGGWESVRG